MKTFKKYGKTIGFFTIFLFVFAAILTCFNLGNLLYQKSTDTFMMIGMSIVFMVIGFNYGKKAPIQVMDIVSPVTDEVVSPPIIST